MAREKMFDPAFQRSFSEAIHKENKIRVKWHLDHSTRLKRGVASCAWDDEPDDDDDDFVAEEKVQEEVPSKEPQVQHDLSARENILMKEMADRKKVSPPAVMKPVPVKTKRLHYKGLSHHGEGRSNYLKARYKKSPESKFYFPICSSWEYGWTYGQDHELNCPDYGRRQIMKTSFFRPNDPQLKPRD